MKHVAHDAVKRQPSGRVDPIRYSPSPRVMKVIRQRDPVAFGDFHDFVFAVTVESSPLNALKIRILPHKIRCQIPMLNTKCPS